VVLAAIAGAHGVRGEVRLKLFAQSIESVARQAAFEAGGRMLTLAALRDAPTGPVARFAEVTTRDAAEALRGTVLTVPRAALPPVAPGEMYVADLIGRPAHAEGLPIGQVVAVENYGAGDIIEIERPGGTRFMLPFARCEPGEGGLALDPEFID